ncbi:ribose-phosphate diphosphokinase [Helcobacillus massiliensis]|uniref:Ribose-phosphate pyrophosphokinase n=1 Tax=Helcobacillus massiliensis TaxID=521392 RepID=A0A839QQL6_9MICO|nr:MULTISPECIES: ribose-phosphate diphosphokinase [Helcobacillus]MBB3022614.1 ribose-phosphate pyrophosphokinase [Helcobacillus massiliensis]MCG7427617.1 ribose-phosphate diphosphokinase [Helcobacillus sp. ACRRO]MCT1558669.1 ribose-phosphate diphosphokinase [Helcobacillus massiliensis]MCT2037295.1 ribose-phosphate diphosphokinase [Helcobacillus massiliensis]MCT2332891.1 ribose-phosphate diphosphokinase [Helcobacillus massiliensis]
MSGISTKGEKHLVLAAGRAHPVLAQEVASELGIDLLPMDAWDFANGEIYVRYGESVRGADVFVLQAHPAPLNNWLVEHLIMVDALKRASAKRITAIAPSYPYARQDKKHRGREPISARLVADLYRTAGIDRMISVDLHAPQVQGYFDGPVDHLMAMPILSGYVKEHYGDEDLCVVSPDAGRIAVAEKWAKVLGSVPLAFIHKSRDPKKPNQAVAKRVIGNVSGKTCILVDDMIDTAGTIVQAVEALKENGANSVVVATTHPIFSDPATERLRNADIREVICTNTLPIPEEKKFETLTQLSIAPLLARAIRAVFDDGSVTSLFDGDV